MVLPAAGRPAVFNAGAPEARCGGGLRHSVGLMAGLFAGLSVRPVVGRSATDLAV